MEILDLLSVPLWLPKRPLIYHLDGLCILHKFGAEGIYQKRGNFCTQRTPVLVSRPEVTVSQNVKITNVKCLEQDSAHYLVATVIFPSVWDVFPEFTTHSISTNTSRPEANGCLSNPRHTPPILQACYQDLRMLLPHSPPQGKKTETVTLQGKWKDPGTTGTVDWSYLSRSEGQDRKFKLESD